MKLKVVRIHEDAKLPVKSKGNVGIDFAMVTPDIDIPSKSRVIVDTGLKLEIPEGKALILKDRSGLANSYGITVLAGVIDSSYRGELKIILFNSGNDQVRIQKGERVAQGILVDDIDYSVEEVVTEKLTETKRGEKGFGSTGTTEEITENGEE